MAKITRGIRNCNPGNIRKGCNWKGMREQQNDASFVQFKTMQWGLRALCVTLRTYVTKRNKEYVSSIINRWAPEQDHNNTKEYIKICALMVGKEVYKSDNVHSDKEKAEMGLNYRFSRFDFQLNNGYPKRSLYGLVKAMCWVESNYEPSMEELCEAIKIM